MDTLTTPCLLLDRDVLYRNIHRMAARALALGVALRPHLKTPKSASVADLLQNAGARGFTVSTLHEAEYFFAAGFDDLLCAVPADGAKARRAVAMLRVGKHLSLMIDSLEAARQLHRVAVESGVIIPLWIEIDVDHYRTGISPASDGFAQLLTLVGANDGLSLAGIMSYAGASYGCDGAAATADLSERHRQALLNAADQTVRAGLARPRLSFGSTPAVLHARTLAGVDEVRCGIYAFQDLFQAGIGACNISDIALSVLATVIGHNPSLNRFVIDAGGLALSKDRSTQDRPFDAGYGLVCDAASGKPLGDLQVTGVSQELGLVSSPSGAPLNFAELPIGSRVRVLPNHSDMTAAAYEQYHVISEHQAPAIWRRTNGW